jgi:hypothetical protein
VGLVALEDIGIVAWLRLPRAARSGQVVPLPWADGDLSTASVNRKLSAVSSFYEFHGRHGAGVGDLLARWRPRGRGGSWRRSWPVIVGPTRVDIATHEGT